MDGMTSEEMQIDKRLAGGSGVGQIRCSRKEQAKKSLKQQQDWLREFARLNGMEYVTDMREAVSASQTKRRPDLDRIFERKRMFNDFDTLIVQDLSRLTRGGVTHGLELFFKFKALGIRLVSLVDGLIDGDDKIIEAAQRFQEARATAKATALNSRRGTIAARKRRKIAYTFNVPFGVDRLIVTESGQPLFRLRNMSDRSQQKLSPDGKTLLHTYPPNGVGERNHHIKQADEFESFAPGAESHVKLVNRMFRHKFKDLQGEFKIARALNNEGVRTLRGKQWTHEAVNTILLNPIYLNRATGDRTAAGEFYKNGPSYPLPVTKQDGSLSIYRSESEWHHESHQEMESFLDFDRVTKEEIYNWQLAEMRRLAQRHRKPRGGNRHHNSSYILSGILREKTEKWSLTGTFKTYRYYRACRAENRPMTGHWLNRHFSADVLEAPIRPLLKRVLDSYGGIVAATESAAKSYLEARQSTECELPTLLAQRDQLLSKVDFWVTQLADLGRDFVEVKTNPIRNEIVAINRRIRSLEQERGTAGAHARADAPKLLKSLKQVASVWNELPHAAVQSILRILVSKMEIDYQTLEVDLELRLPSWVVTQPDIFGRCLEKETLSHDLFETHTFWAVPMGAYRFLYRSRRQGGMLLLPSQHKAVA
jgi:hypothetical protein